MALLGPISEFFHMCECCSVLPYNTKKRFRQFPARSNDSNWIRSPRSMFLHFIRFFPKCQRESNFFRFLFCFFSCLEWLNSQKKRIFFFKNFKNFKKFENFIFCPKKGQRDFFQKKIHLAVFGKKGPKTGPKWGFWDFYENWVISFFWFFAWS